MSAAVLIAHIDAGKQAKKYDYVADRGISLFSIITYPIHTLYKPKVFIELKNHVCIIHFIISYHSTLSLNCIAKYYTEQTLAAKYNMT